MIVHFKVRILTFARDILISLRFSFLYDDDDLMMKYNIIDLHDFLVSKTSLTCFPTLLLTREKLLDFFFLLGSHTTNFAAIFVIFVTTRSVVRTTTRMMSSHHIGFNNYLKCDVNKRFNHMRSCNLFSRCRCLHSQARIKPSNRLPQNIVLGKSNGFELNIIVFKLNDLRIEIFNEMCQSSLIPLSSWLSTNKNGSQDENQQKR